MKAISGPIEGILIFEPEIFSDERGSFMETFRESWFAEIGLNYSFVQDNFSVSEKGVLRGLHYQVVKPQGKLVRVTEGEIFDVVVDLRKGSATFGQYYERYLSAREQRLLWVPPGFAHGFLAMSERVQVAYKCTEYYSPENERTLLWKDPELGIEWPLEGELKVSKKDSLGSLLSESEAFYE